VIRRLDHDHFLRNHSRSISICLRTIFQRNPLPSPSAPKHAFLIMFSTNFWHSCSAYCHYLSRRPVTEASRKPLRARVSETKSRIMFAKAADYGLNICVPPAMQDALVAK
jgi:hypothetical protein